MYLFLYFLKFFLSIFWRTTLETSVLLCALMCLTSVNIICIIMFYQINSLTPSVFILQGRKASSTSRCLQATPESTTTRSVWTGTASRWTTWMKSSRPGSLQSCVHVTFASWELIADGGMTARIGRATECDTSASTRGCPLVSRHRYVRPSVLCNNETSSSSPFPTRWGQWPEFLISRMICPGHPPGWSAVPACPFRRNLSISILVLYATHT